MTNLSRLSRLAVVTVLGVGSLQAAAQPVRGVTLRVSTAIELAAAMAARGIVSKGAVFDVRTSVREGTTVARRSSQAQRIAAALGLAPSTGQSAYSCPTGRPESCQLAGDSNVVTFELPKITGDTAVVLMRHFFRTPSKRKPAGEETQQIIVARHGSAWVFVGLGVAISP